MFTQGRHKIPPVTFPPCFSTKNNISVSTMLIVAPGEYSGFQVTGMIEWGQESRLPKKFPGASNKTLEILLTKNLPPPPPKELHAEFPSLRWDAALRGLDMGTLPGIFRLFRIPKKVATSIKPPKRIVAKFSNAKKSLDHSRHLKSGVPPPRLSHQICVRQKRVRNNQIVFRFQNKANRTNS